MRATRRHGSAAQALWHAHFQMSGSPVAIDLEGVRATSLAGLRIEAAGVRTRKRATTRERVCAR